MELFRTMHACGSREMSMFLLSHAFSRGELARSRSKAGPLQRIGVLIGESILGIRPLPRLLAVCRFGGIEMDFARFQRR